MRFIITIISVLMLLGLAAFGVVSAQKTSTARSQATASDWRWLRAREPSPLQRGVLRSIPSAKWLKPTRKTACGGKRSRCRGTRAGGAGDPGDARRPLRAQARRSPNLRLRPPPFRRATSPAAWV